MQLSRAIYAAALACALHVASPPAEAEEIEVKVLVTVQDIQQRPVEGLMIGFVGRGNALKTGPEGKALLTFVRNTKDNDLVLFQIVESPAGEDFEILFPLSHGQLFDNKVENSTTVTVIPRDRYTALMTHPRMRESTTRIQSTRGKLRVLKSAQPRAK
jgi:hypothetical protein